MSDEIPKPNNPEAKQINDNAVKKIRNLRSCRLMKISATHDSTYAMLTTKEDSVPFPNAISEKLRMSQTITVTIDIATHTPKGKRDFSVIL
jgi:hypothetical protein